MIVLFTKCIIKFRSDTPLWRNPNLTSFCSVCPLYHGCTWFFSSIYHHYSCSSIHFDSPERWFIKLTLIILGCIFQDMWNHHYGNHAAGEQFNLNMQAAAETNLSKWHYLLNLNVIIVKNKLRTKRIQK